MAIRTELSCRVANSPGALAQLCDALAREHVALQALHLEANGRLRLIVDNPLHALGVLQASGPVESREVLCVSVPNGAGGAVQALKLLAQAGVNVEYAYGAAVDGAAMALLVVGVVDAARAAAAAGW